ncbi:MAG: MFS transporter [Cryobacterium sp.]|nr:MFS transporter [Cryobacterium sp.]MCO5294496.1 MFS transporter [Homoserinimonas sp.]MCW5944470.1 MFS transporter [Cryobacterium sp.]
MIETEAIQERVVRTLIFAQILGGIGLGATVSVGALLAAEVSGSPAWSGMAATMSTLGAALIAVPLARAAQARGRRVALSVGSIVAALGAVLATVSAAIGSFPLLLVGLALAGAGSATNLQARFSATDLAEPQHRARQLSLVVWSTTIGAVLGPNLIEPGEIIGHSIGLPVLTGPFVFTVGAQLAAVFVYYFGLQPDPLLTALKNAPARDGAAPPRHGLATLRVNALARYSVVAVAFSHATMVAMMSMTPVHLYGHGATLMIVGFALSLHIAGMYALSPVFGWVADRWGRIPTILFGQGILVVSLLTAWIGAESQVLVVISVILLGLGWSASTISGSTLVAESAPVDDRAGLQGVSDLIMNSTAAVFGALAGPVLAIVGYSGLGVACLLLVGVVTVWSVVELSTGSRSSN